jgi:hypothetical protein
MFISIKDEDAQEADRRGENYLKNPYRTGKMAVISAESDFFSKVLAPEFAADILKKRVCFVPDSFWDQLGLPTEDIDNRKE